MSIGAKYDVFRIPENPPLPFVVLEDGEPVARAQSESLGLRIIAMLIVGNRQERALRGRVE